MCAIAGIVSNERIQDNQIVERMCQSMTHRGPDFSGIYRSENEKLIFGHNRLSIIDLSDEANQPFHFKNQELSIVYNGEIYNFLQLRKLLLQKGYKFQTNSDTEVLLTSYAEWGKDCLIHLNGMFSFAIYDRKRNIVFFARDRAGQKPLYYYNYNGTLYFASELKALMANLNLPRKINLEALDCYLTMGFIPSDRCILDGYHKLPAACTMTFDMCNANTEVSTYWKIPEYDPCEENLDEDKLLLNLEKLFEESVKRQLVADVPIGILLSGGIDSSLITAMASRNSSNVKTFNVAFPGFGVLDESSHARLIAEYYDTEHIELEVKDSSAHLLPLLARQFDEPMADSSMFPTWLISKMVKQNCTVVLGGDGGDELFGGYSHYSRMIAIEKYLKTVPNFIKKSITNFSRNFLPLGFAKSNIRTWIMATGVDMSCDLPEIRPFYDPFSRLKLLKNFDEYKLTAEEIRTNLIPKQADLMQRATRMDFKNYLTEDILVKVDRASMMNSLEMRTPFLDVPLVEFAFQQVSSNFKANENQTKILLKKLAGKTLPSKFELNRKQGFAIPISQWLKKGPFRDLFWDTLLQEDCIFDSHFVQSLLKGQDKGRKNGERLFALVFFELWRKEYGAHF